MKKTRLAASLVLALVLTAPSLSAAPSRDNSGGLFARIVKIVRHIVTMDDPSWPKP